MVLQQDSITAHKGVGAHGDSVVHQHTTITPAMVLSWLPRSATPAQQDSAIQSRFKPAEIRWSQRPDTLHLPGHDRGHNMMDIQLPQYYREGFFSKDSLFHPELAGGRQGIAGDPIPYSIHGDDILTSILLLLFLLTVVAFSNTRQFIARQTKSFFYFHREGTTEASETVNELRFQLFLAFQTCVLVSLAFYFYTTYFIGQTFVLVSHYQLIALFLAITIAYFLFKSGLYAIINAVFFDSKKIRQWTKSYLYIIALEGVLLFPAVILLAYFGLNIHSASIYVAITLLIVKFLTFFKCFLIFFQRNVVKLQIILYFCTLEIVPLLVFWGVLVMTANSLKINF